MQFSPNWDRKLLEMLHSCEAGEKAVITGNIIEYELHAELALMIKTIGFTSSFFQANGLKFWH